ncbi:DsbA family oxidoreductase [Chitinophaga sp. Mgbs1]|uniref:DsbA family oxidoreductase n=1 Tax=Chitinophaga solisilvae TaxID=1233460 RepID=A0A433WFB1_9BACT|nr:DsbA family oxidoreductase [Chitinophaga solisilvae]
MKVEIWSDIMCPFCYIGKRKFEAALEQFPEKDSIQVEWKSFQLNAGLKQEPGRDIYDYLASIKGESREWAAQALAQMTGMAKESGLDFHFEKAVVANSFDAHRLIQFAKQHQLGDAAEEQLFAAYFTEGKDVSNHETLADIGAAIGLNRDAVVAMLRSDDFSGTVNTDGLEAQQLGARGVPFFVMDRKLGVAGAQPVEVFTQALTQAFGEWKKAQPLTTLENIEGPVCSPDGTCN